MKKRTKMVKMQLRKDDVKTGKEIRKPTYIKNILRQEFLDFAKFQQVRKFYEEYKDNLPEFEDTFPKIFKKYLDSIRTRTNISQNEHIKLWRDWLFNHCFVEGLK